MKFQKYIDINLFNLKDRKRNLEKKNICENLTFVRFHYLIIIFKK